jgi:hypothetical protein
MLPFPTTQHKHDMPSATWPHQSVCMPALPLQSSAQPNSNLFHQYRQVLLFRSYGGKWGQRINEHTFIRLGRYCTLYTREDEWKSVRVATTELHVRSASMRILGQVSCRRIQSHPRSRPCVVSLTQSVWLHGQRQGVYINLGGHSLLSWPCVFFAPAP